MQTLASRGIPRSGISHRVLTSRSAMRCGPGSGLVSCSFHQSQVIPDDSIFQRSGPLRADVGGDSELGPERLLG
jgi:hypothetical protein